MKKDITISSISVLIWAWLLLYLVYIYHLQLDIVPSQERTYDLIIIGFSAILWIFLVLYWVLQICLNKHRIKQVALGIFIILRSYYVWIVDNPDKLIFLKDFLCIIWTVMSILWFTKLCIYSKCDKKLKEKQIESWEIEIIEV